MMKLRIAVAALLLSDVFTANAANFFVSLVGNDSNPGTQDKPFATPARAQQAVRVLAGKEPVAVNFRGGVYYLPQTFVFTAEDSGSEQAPVVYQASPGEEVVLSGGVKLMLDWRPFTNGIYRATIPKSNALESPFQFDQLFINGRRRQLARYPNFDPAQRILGGYAADAFSLERATRWSNPKGGYIHALHYKLWGDFHYVITGKDAKGEVTYEGGWQNNQQGLIHKNYRYVENIFEELDAVDEWFHDAKSNTLYFFPPAGLDLAKATVEIVRLRNLIEFRGTQAKPVKYVTLRGLTFRHAARTFMDTKEPLQRSDWRIYRGGAVFLNGTEDCAITDCAFDQVGGNTVFVNNYNRRVVIRGCLIADSGASGVAFVGDPKAVRNLLFPHQAQAYETIDKTPGPQTDNYPADCLVEDCLITRIGRFEKQTAGVQISMSQGITVRHCSIYEVPRAGINISEGTWGGHLIEGCDVFDTVLETEDHGSFNSWGRDRFWRLDHAPESELPGLALLDAVKPTIIRNNRWQCDHGWDIDLDDGSSNYEIYDNLMLHGGLKFREGFHRRAWNNIMVNNSFHPHAWYANSGDVLTNNIFMGAMRPAAMDEKLTHWGRLIDFNLYTSSDADRREFAYKGCDAHSLVGNPLFLDPAHGDFRVKDDSPALKLGFRNFPMNQFGVRKPELKAMAKMPSIPVLHLDPASDAAPETRITWRGAILRNPAVEEYSAYGRGSDEGGVLVVEVPVGSGAAKVGLQKNDFIYAADGKPLKNVEAFLKAIRAIPSTSTERLAIIRKQKTEAVEVSKSDAD